MALIARRNPNETWRQAVERIAGKEGLAYECLAMFDTFVREGGKDEDIAAWMALHEWDCLEFVDDPSGN